MSSEKSQTPIADERDRVRGITTLFNQHKIDQGTLNYYLENGCSIHQARSHVLNQIPPAKPIGCRDPYELGLGGKDLKNYSLARALLHSTAELGGLEREVHDQLYKRLPEHRRMASRGTLIPVHDLSWGSRGNTLNTTNFEQGGALAPTILDGSRFIDALRQQSLVMSMGPTVIKDQGPDLDLPRQTDTGKIFWVNENEVIGDADLKFDRVGFKPKTCGSIVTFTRTMLMQSSIDLENAIKSDLIRGVAKAIDTGVISGDGIKSPLGLFSRPELELFPTDPNGDDISLDLLCEMEKVVANANADGGNLGYMTNPNLRKKAKTTTENGSNISQWLWQPSDMGPRFGKLNGYPAIASNAIPNDFEVGDTTNANGLIYGDWSALYLVFFGVLETLVNPYGAGNFQTGSVSVRVMQSMNCNLRNNESFVWSNSVKS